jgi:hypothetical protein
MNYWVRNPVLTCIADTSGSLSALMIREVKHASKIEVYTRSAP